MITGPAQLREWLSRSRTTHRQLAERIRRSRSFVSNIAAGNFAPSLEAAVAIERETGIPSRAWVEAAPSEAA